MSLDPFLDAGLVIQTHALAATLAILVGPIAIYRKRRDSLHKISGYIWVLAMGFTALSSFFIHSFAILWGLSPIHGLAVLALWSLWVGMRHIFAGRVRQHAAAMKSLYWTGLMIAGLFNFLPGRTVNRMLFNDMREAGYIVIALGGIAIATYLLRGRMRGGLNPAR